MNVSNFTRNEIDSFPEILSLSEHTNEIQSINKLLCMILIHILCLQTIYVILETFKMLIYL